MCVGMPTFVQMEAQVGVQDHPQLPVSLITGARFLNQHRTHPYGQPPQLACSGESPVSVSQGWNYGLVTVSSCHLHELGTQTVVLVFAQQAP